MSQAGHATAIHWPFLLFIGGFGRRSILMVYFAVTIGREQRMVAVLARRHTIVSFEVSYEMTFIGETNTSDDLFDAEESGGEQCCGFLHSQ